MKIGEYEQMMSWLTRPETPTPIEPRENFALGSETRGRQRTIDVDDDKLVKKWRKSLTQKNPVKWITFLKNNFEEKTSESLRARIRKNVKDFNPIEEFEAISGDIKNTRLNTIQKMVDAHNNSDSIKYRQEDIFDKIGASRLTYLDNPDEMAIINEMDTPEDKVTKAFDKIINQDMKLYDPKSKGSVKNKNIIYQMISDIVSPKGGSSRYQLDQRFIDKALSTHKPYLNIKKDFDYFAKTAKPFIGKNFSEGFERAKFIRGGLDIRNLEEVTSGYEQPERNILNFAIRESYLNQKQGIPPQVEFYKIDKKGNKVGKPLNFNDLPRDVKTLTRIFDTDKYGFEYKGQFFNKNTLKTEAKQSGLFDEVYEIAQQKQKLVPDPNNPDGAKITLKKLLQDSGDKLTIGHNDKKGGVTARPFSDLRLEGAKFNIAIFNAYDKVDNLKARKMIVDNLQGNFGNFKGEEYQQAFINSKSKLAKDMFTSPEAVLEQPTYYRGAGQKVLADMGKGFFEQSGPFKSDIARVAGIDLPEYEENKSQYRKNLVAQLAKKNNLSPELVKEELSNVQKVIRKMQGQMNSGMDPKLLTEYLGAEMKDLAAFGSKYGGDALSKVGKGITGIDLPIFQVMFGSMYDIEQDSPLWLTLPAAFTDEVSNVFKLYDKSKGRFGLGKAKDFGKFLASSFVPRVLRNPIFKGVSKIGKAGSLATPVLELGKQVYLNEKRKGMLPDIARQFDIPIEKAREGYDNYIKQGQIRGMESMVDDMEIPEISKQGQDNLDSTVNSFKQIGALLGLNEDPYAEKESIYTRGKENPMSLDRALYPNRQNFRDGTKLLKIANTGKKGLDYLKDFLKKKTITVKRGESGTEGASSYFSNPDYKGKYYTPEGGGFGTAAEDARYYSKLGGDEGSPKVFTAELTPEEIKEGLRLRSLDSQDPEIGDIILPKSAEDKVKIDYLNTIRAKFEKYFNMAEGGRVNFADGPKDPSKKGIGSLSKRNFLKMLTLIPAGILALRGGPNLIKKVQKTAPVVKENLAGAPDHFIKLVAKIKALGNNFTPKYGSQPRENVTLYKDYKLTEQLDSGRTTIQRFKDSEVDYYDEMLMEETYMDYIPGKSLADETTKGKNIPDEYIEDTSYMRTSGPQKGDIMETVSGVSDDIFEEAGVPVPEKIRKK